MSVLNIRMIGDPVLRTPTSPVQSIDQRILSLVQDMYATMDDARGIGLAANQVGVGLRIFTYDVAGVRGAVINPELELSGEPVLTPREEARGPAEGENLVQEGCLSVRDIYGPVARPQQARLTGSAPDGSPLEVEATGLLAACFQHEMDHLDGKLFLDRLRGEEKRRALQTLRERDYGRTAS
ncbi:peptide deformylase [Nesterenkonia lacusekhoensis]|uniref:Peptide deformylase n=1 Tax=Nesterenkonia lacusekhoensis TaxID=150832 RepID=A0ABS4T1S3_9MICC|nr:peptide deformylase [Nesterenkonia lacusekhoensis]MBP2318400.1 peptide deformylase [Nesterenkonia lacusekhoensis]